MMDFDNIKAEFHEFKKKNRDKSFSKIDTFFEEIKEEYLNEKTNKVKEIDDLFGDIKKLVEEYGAN